MPDFVHDGKVYYNPVEFAMARIGGTWKIPILWRLKEKPFRYSQLKRSIPHISDKMLTSQLRELEDDGMVHREVYPQVPPRTEYSLTEKGQTAVPLIEAIRAYGVDLMEMEGMDVEKFRLPSP